MARYRVGAGGNWNDTNYWSDASNGTTGFSVPGQNDDVFFDQYATGTVTVNVAASCLSLDFTSGTGFVGTFAGSLGLTIYGSLTLNSGMTRSFTGAITFAATGTGKTITLNTKTLASAITFNGSGGGWTLQDTFNNGTANITLTNGTLDTNDVTVTCGAFALGAGTKTLTLGASVINCSSTGTFWNLNTNATGLTFDAETSEIKNTGAFGVFQGGGKTYYKCTFNHGANYIAGYLDTYGANTYTNLTITNSDFRYCAVIIRNDITVTGTFTATGYSQAAKMFIYGGAYNTTITAAAVSITDTNFRGMTGAGTAAPFTGTRIGLIGDQCSGITSDTPRNLYWINQNGGNYYDLNNWSTSSGGAGGAGVPMPQDTAIFDRLSVIANGKTITMGMLNFGNVDFSDIQNTLTFYENTYDVFFTCSSFVLSGFLTISGSKAIWLQAFDSGLTIDMRSATWAMWAYIYNRVAGSTITFISGGTFTNTGNPGISFFPVGTIDFNDQDITFYKLTFTVGTLKLGNGNIVLNGTGTIWTKTSGDGTIDAEGSTIKISNGSASARTFNGGSATYNIIKCNEGGSSADLTFGSSMTVGTLSDTTAIAHNIIFTNSTTATVTTWDISGNQFKPITIKNSSGTTRATISCANNITASNLVIQNLAKTGAGTFDAWESRDAGNNTGFSIRNGNAFLTF